MFLLCAHTFAFITIQTGRVMKGSKTIVIRYIVMLLIFAVLTAGLVIFFSSREPVVYSAPLKPVEIIRPERRIIESAIDTTGYIEASAMIPVVPFVQGTIEEYLIEPGMDVGKDDVIAVIDKRPYELQLMQAEAQFKAVESALMRTEPLYESGAATQQDYEMVKAQHDAASAQLELARLQLSYADVVSPVSGTVLMAPSATGSIASSEQPLAVIADLDELVVNISAGERYFSRISSAPDSLKITVSSPEGSVSEADVVSVSPFIDPTSKTFKVKARILDPSGFTPGMFVRIHIVYDSVECSTLPVSALTAEGAVYMLSSDNTAESIVFDRMASDSSYFQIPEGYESTDFIIRGQNSILSGEKVAVVSGENL